MFWKAITDFIWYFIQMALYEILYLHTNQIGGWTHPMMRVFLCSIFVSDALYMTLFSANFDQFSERIRKGELDLILAKPVNSQFMTSCFRMQPTYLINWVFSVAWLMWALKEYQGSVGLRDFFMLNLVCGMGTVVAYSVRFIMLSFTVNMGRAESLMQFWFVIYRFALKPDFLYPPWLSQVLKTAVPMAFVASVPAHILLGVRHEDWIFSLIAIAGGFLFLSSLLWKRALTHYSSASS